MHALRTRFKKDIVAEFLPPRLARSKRPHRKANRVIIFCSGMPSVPSKTALMEFFAKKGFWCFNPRYRGTWESGGKFLDRSPEKDILDVIDGLTKEFTSIWDGKKYRVQSPEVYIIGTSFGGAAALLVSRDRRVKKVVAISPVIDWRADSRIEPLDFLARLTKNAFGEAYRLARGGWQKLKKGKFYNPTMHAKNIDGKKTFVIQAKDDKYVLWRPAVKFAKETGAELLLLKKGGHLSSSIVTKPVFYKKIKKFLDSVR